MYRVESKPYSFHRIALVELKTYAEKASLISFGKSRIDLLVLGIFEALGIFFASCKPIDVKIEVHDGGMKARPETFKTVRFMLDRFLKAHGEDFCKKSQYPSAMIENKSMLNLFTEDDVEEVSLKSLNTKIKRYIKTEATKISIDSVKNFIQAANKIDTLDLPVYIDPKTAAFSFQKPRKTDWLTGRIYIDENGHAKGEFAPEIRREALVRIERLMRLFAKIRSATADFKTSLEELLTAVIHKEFKKEILPYTFDDCLENQPLSIQMKISTQSGALENAEMAIATEANSIRIHGSHYIATHQPADEESVLQFWELLFQHDCPLVVKLAKTPIGAAYWPNPSGDLASGLSITLKSEEILFKTLVRRTFELKKGGISKTVRQIDFSGWPDMKTPKIKDFNQLLLTVDAESANLKKDQPILVHCAAGIGRTGTFIAAHSTRSQEKPDYKKTIFEIRKQRPNKKMVETEEQYAFLMSLNSDNSFS